MDKSDIISQAKWEVEFEEFEALVEAEKKKLREHKPWWHRVIPFTITITRR